MTLDTGVTIGPEITIDTSRVGHLARRLAAELAHRLDLELEAVHVALGEVAAARVERQAPARREQVVEREELVGLLGGEEAVLDEAHQDAAGEVLVALQHVDVLGPDAAISYRRGATVVKLDVA